MILAIKMALVLQKRKQAKTRVELNGKRIRSRKWNSVLFVRFEPSIPGLKFDAYLWSKVALVHDLVPNLKVVRFMPIVIAQTTLLFIDEKQNRLLNHKLTYILFVCFNNFFKVAHVNACLILWNTNVISFISIKNFITYLKHRQILFLTGTLMPLLWQNSQERRRSTPFKVRYRKLKTL